MGKIMALDVGEKTIGVAFCDEGTKLAFPGKTLWRQEGKKRDMAALRQLVAENDVKRIVVGLPLMPDGTRGSQAAKVEDFLATLRNNVRIPIIPQDERLSTQEASERLLAANRRHEDHKQTIDSVAAALILQWHLDEANSAGALLAMPHHDTAPNHADAPEIAAVSDNTGYYNTAPENATLFDSGLINHQPSTGRSPARRKNINQRNRGGNE